jgi:hypothetical protein
MKVIIAGSRGITDYNTVLKAIEESGFKITVVISGEAIGVDKLGEEYAKNNNLPIKRFPANWNKFGKSAGYVRNKEMSVEGDALIAIWNGSPGTRHMINIANEDGLKISIFRVFDKDGKNMEMDL